MKFTLEVENKAQYLADMEEMIAATRRLKDEAEAAADEMERLNAAREKAESAAAADANFRTLLR